MEENAEKASKTVAQYESDLLQTIHAKDTEHSALEPALAKLRDACQDFIFIDYDAAISNNVERRLWDAHGKVNKKFRPYLASFRDREGKKKHVERRKAENIYLKFIKSSMRFYRGFIQRLASHFKGVPEIFEVARKFSLDTFSTDPPVRTDLEMKRKLLRSCHATLIYLGDLSRYRETELVQKDRNWGPATGYYDLASTIDPTSGQSFNQLAVIDLLDKHHLRAVYHLYRALMVVNPPVAVQGNLDLELKKIRTRHERMEPLYPQEEQDSLRELEVSFLQLHAKCVHDPDFNNLDSQQEMLLTAMANGVTNQSFEGAFDSVLRKMCLINISAYKHASEKALEAAKHSMEEGKHLLLIFMRLLVFNCATLRTLFGLLSNEFQPSKSGIDGRHEPPPGSMARLTPVARRVLPVLRTYSAWLVGNVLFVLQCDTPEIRIFWTMYVEALNSLVNAFAIRSIADIPHLLKEDEDTLTFVAIDDKAKELHVKDRTGNMKPTHAEDSNPTAEMLFRIKGLVKDGFHLCKQLDGKPLQFAENNFFYLPSQPQRANELPQQAALAHPLSQRIGGQVSDSNLDPGTLSDVNVGTASTEMETMVNDLVGPKSRRSGRATMSPANRTEGVYPQHKRAASHPDSSTAARDFARQVQPSSPASSIIGPRLSSNQQAPLPGVFQSPFTPLPGEQPGSSPHPGSLHQLPPPSMAPPPRSSALFEQDLSQQRQAIHNRTSPMSSFAPTVQSYDQTPTGFSTFARNNSPSQPDFSTWPSAIPLTSTPDVSTAAKRSSGASPFGAIGAGRPGDSNAKTPTSGQGR